MNPRSLCLPFFLVKILLLYSFYGHACDYAYISGCATSLNIEANGPNNGFQVSDCSYLSVFHNHDFGNVTSLRITEAKSITWESCNNEVFNARFYYRIYQQGNPTGSFSYVELPQSNVTTFGTYRTRYRDDQLNLNLLAGLPAGNYFVEVYFESDVSFNLGSNTVNDVITKNNNGNYYRAAFTLGNPQGSNLNLTLPDQQNVSCNGGNDGSATVNVTNGISPVNYAWSNGANGATISNLSVGTYTVTATDANNTTGIFDVSISQPTAIQANLSTTNVGSASASNGSASVQPSGGTQPYTFMWGNGSTASAINNLTLGTYQVTVTDDNGCTITETATVNTPGTPPSGYCVSQGDYPWLDWITKVKLNTIDHNSGKAQYSNFTNHSTNLSKGTSHTITIRNSFSWQTYDEHLKVWIDYNRNGTFEEPTEIAFQSSSIAPPLGTPFSLTDGTINIPTTASTGPTRMRVAIKRESEPSPCETIPFGEVEDYMVNIEDGGQTGCNMTTDLSGIICNDNGTASDPSDDTFGFSLLVNANSSNSNWSTPFNGQIYSGTYGQVNSISDLPIVPNPFDITITEVNDASCSTTITIVPPPTCSTGNSNIGYCEAESDFPWHDWIASVLFENIDNFSDKTRYSDFTTLSTDVNRGGTYPIALTSGFSWYTHHEHWKVWIDYNQNAVFEEPTEVAFSRFEPSPPNGTIDHTIFGSITIPSNAMPGTTRMRIAMQRDIEPGPCDMLTFGEIEDYHLSITDNFTGGGSGGTQTVQLEGTAGIENIDIFGLVKTETPYSYWILEKTTNLIDFETIGQGNAPQTGGSLFLKEQDNDPSNGINHYRLLLFDENGQVVSKKQTSVPFQLVAIFNLFPNPANEQVSIQLSDMAGKNVRIEIYNQLGQPMYRKVFQEVSVPIYSIPTSGWKDGFYRVMVFPDNRKMVSKQLVLAK